MSLKISRYAEVAFYGFLAFFGSLTIILTISKTFDLGIIASFFVFAMALVPILVLFNKLFLEEEPSNNYKRITPTERVRKNRYVQEILQLHMKALSIKKGQLVYKDDYGIEKREKWDKELNYFINNVLLKKLVDVETRIYMAKNRGALIRVIEENISTHNKSQSGVHVFADNIDPYEYEHLCASILKNNGWKAQATQRSGDQGVDVIAEKGDLKVAIQCKKYSQPVGNKAVQEAYAGKGWASATHAVVISNASYTPSAHQLAERLKVHLLHHDQLSYLESVVRND